MTRRVKIAFAVPLAVFATVAVLTGVGMLAGCGSQGASETSSADSGSQAAGQAVDGGSAGSAMSAEGAATKSVAGSEAPAQDFAAAVPPASAPSTHYLMRTGDMSLLVARGTLLANVDRIKAMTAAMNGYVMSSSIGTQSGGAPEPTPLDDTSVSSGAAEGSDAVASDSATGQTLSSNPYASLVVRVPEQLFDTAIKRFSKLGDVQTASTSSEDVTSQYVDLQARLRHYRAVDRRLVGFLQQTHTVNQMLTVQDRIDKVQLTIEELSAQIKSLSETTTYGTLSVYVSEKDRLVAAVHASNTFGGTLANSIDLLGRGVRVAGLAVTALAPFLVVFGGIGVLVWYLVRRVRRNRRRAATPPAAAA
jgi:hypothetical protein